MWYNIVKFEGRWKNVWEGKKEKRRGEEREGEERMENLFKWTVENHTSGDKWNQFKEKSEY